MQYGIKIPNLGRLPGREPLLQMARKAEELDYEIAWVSDHVVFDGRKAAREDIGPRSFPVGYDENATDPFVVLAAVAAITERIKLGTSVLVLPYRNPLLTAKAWASLDMLSNGRCICAVGSGWQEAEFAALRAPGGLEHRGAVTNEWIRIFRTCWDDPLPSFQGRFYSFEPVHFYPKPAHRIPIWVGGGPGGGWRRAARYGDGYHATALPPAEARDAVRTIRELIEKEGRDPAAFQFTTLCDMNLLDKPMNLEPDGRRTLVGTIREIVEYVKEMEEIGFSHIGLRVQYASGSTLAGLKIEPSLERALEMMQRFHAEVMPLTR